MLEKSRHARACFLLLLTSLACGCEQKDETKRETTEQIAPGLHTEKVDASQCPKLDPPEKPSQVKGSDLSIKVPPNFILVQRETQAHREMILKRVVFDDADAADDPAPLGALTMRLMVDVDSKDPTAHDELRQSSSSPRGPVNQVFGEVSFGEGSAPIYFTDRGIDATLRVFVPQEDGTERGVALLVGAGSARACHEPLTQLAKAMLSTLAVTKP